MSTPAANLPAATSAPSSRLTEVERDAPSIVRDAMRTLREQQRAVLALHYFEELPLAQIAPVLGVTEARVCQLHRKALRALRGALHAPLGLAA